MINEYQQKEVVVDYGLKRMERKIETIERKSQMTDRDKIEIGKTKEFIQTVRELKGAYKKTLDIGLGKLPPQDLDLERAVLGALILEGNSINLGGNQTYLDKVRKYLMIHHFYLDAHKQIYESILRLHQQNLAIDMRSVVADIRKGGHLEMCGGITYIPQLTTLVNSARNLEYQARLLIEHAIKRELILMAGQLLHDAYKDSTDCFELIHGTRDKLAEIEQINVRQ